MRSAGMDDDAERGLIFISGLLLGMIIAWLLLGGRRSRGRIFDKAADLASSLTARAGDLSSEVSKAARRRRLRLVR